MKKNNKVNRWLGIDTLVLTIRESEEEEYYPVYSIEHEAKKIFFRGDGLTKSDLDYNNDYYIKGKRAENILYRLEKDFGYKVYYEPFDYTMFNNGTLEEFEEYEKENYIEN